MEQWLMPAKIVYASAFAAFSSFLFFAMRGREINRGIPIIMLAIDPSVEKPFWTIVRSPIPEIM